MEGVHRYRETGPGCDLRCWFLSRGPSRPGPILSLSSRTWELRSTGFPKGHRREAPAVERTPVGGWDRHAPRPEQVR
jgi:hypothetical protein